MKRLTILSLLFSAALLLAQPQYPANWTNPFPPHKVIANVYYVGSEDLAVYLITTPAGHLLINSNLDISAPAIQASVRSEERRVGKECRL